MKHIIVIPDSFKGTLSSSYFCDVAREVIRAHFPDCRVSTLPVADGGEGSVDAFLCACGGKRISVTVRGPYGEPTESIYGVLPDGTAVVEMAAAAGLPMVGDNKNPERTTTYGVGELLRHAVAGGAKKVILGLGGSATNDGGCGAAAALGAEFYNGAGERFVPVGGTLKEIARVETGALRELLRGVEIVAMCDIDNPLCGPRGAAAVFAPQKGATPAMVQRLDEGLSHLAEIVKRDLQKEILTLNGAGAAGGMGGGAVAFLDASPVMGIEAVLDTVGFDALAESADLVISGEGKLDSQSLRGKVVIGVARRAKRAGVPLIAVVGDVGEGVEAAYEMGVSAVFSINRVAVDFAKAKQRSREDLRATLDDIFRFAAAMKL